MITIVDRKTLDVLGQVQVEKQLGGGHHIATDSKGNLYIAADRRRHAAAVVQGDVGGGEIKSRLLSTVIARRLALGLF